MGDLAPMIIWDPEEASPEPSPVHHCDSRNVRGSRQGHLVTGSSPDLIPGDPALITTENPWHFVGARWTRKDIRNGLPPLSISFNVSIVQDLAEISVTQSFWNTRDRSIKNGEYKFPLPSGCTVSEFTCWIGQTKLESQAKPKDAARAVYQDAVNDDRMAGLLEQNSPEIFSAALGNIPGHTKLRVKITLVTLLKQCYTRKRKITTLTIPTIIARKSGKPEFTPPDPASIVVPEQLSIQVSITTHQRIEECVSTIHNITTALGTKTTHNWNELNSETLEDHEKTALVKFDGGTEYLDRDFVLDIVTSLESDTEEPQAWLEPHRTLRENSALMLTIPPGLMLDASSCPGEILFLIDRSDSMKDEFRYVKEVMTFFVRAIPLGWRFNVWWFGCECDSIWQSSVSISENDHLRKALNCIGGLQADMGDKEVLPALEKVVQSRTHTSTTEIIVLTDGNIWRLDETLAFIRQAKNYPGNVRFFALGVGSRVSHALIQGIGRNGGGYSESIPCTAIDKGDWDKARTLLEAAMTVHAGSLQVRLKDAGSSSLLWDFHSNGNASNTGKIITYQSPANVSAMSPFPSNRIFALFKASSEFDGALTITIEDLNSGGQRKTLPVVQLSPGLKIHKLAARAVLDDLERGQSDLHARSPRLSKAEESRQVRQRGELIATTYSLASKWTSLVLVEQLSYQDDPFTDTSSRGAAAIPDLNLLCAKDIPHVYLESSDSTVGYRQPEQSTAVDKEGPTPDSKRFEVTATMPQDTRLSNKDENKGLYWNRMPRGKGISHRNSNRRKRARNQHYREAPWNSRLPPGTHRLDHPPRRRFQRSESRHGPPLHPKSNVYNKHSLRDREGFVDGKTTNSRSFENAGSSYANVHSREVTEAYSLDWGRISQPQSHGQIQVRSGDPYSGQPSAADAYRNFSGPGRCQGNAGMTYNNPPRTSDQAMQDAPYVQGGNFRVSNDYLMFHEPRNWYRSQDVSRSLQTHLPRSEVGKREEHVKTLINYQHASGFFSIDSETREHVLDSPMRYTINKLKTESYLVLNDAIILTIVIIIALEYKYQDQKNRWKQICTKAWQYLRSVMSERDLSMATETTKQLINEAYEKTRQ